MAKTTLVQQLSVQKSENLKAVELFLTTRALFHTLKSLVFRQNRQAQATVKFKRMSGKINSVNATFTILIHLTSRILPPCTMYLKSFSVFVFELRLQLAYSS